VGALKIWTVPFLLSVGSIRLIYRSINLRGKDYAYSEGLRVNNPIVGAIVNIKTQVSLFILPLNADARCGRLRLSSPSSPRFRSCETSSSKFCPSQAKVPIASRLRMAAFRSRPSPCANLVALPKNPARCTRTSRASATPALARLAGCCSSRPSRLPCTRRTLSTSSPTASLEASSLRVLLWDGVWSSVFRPMPTFSIRSLLIRDRLWEVVLLRHHRESGKTDSAIIGPFYRTCTPICTSTALTTLPLRCRACTRQTR